MLQSTQTLPSTFGTIQTLQSICYLSTISEQKKNSLTCFDTTDCTSPNNRNIFRNGGHKPMCMQKQKILKINFKLKRSDWFLQKNKKTKKNLQNKDTKCLALTCLKINIDFNKNTHENKNNSIIVTWKDPIGFCKKIKKQKKLQNKDTKCLALTCLKIKIDFNKNTHENKTIP